MGLFGGKKDSSTTAEGQPTVSTTETTATGALPTVDGWKAGTWTIDAVHSEVSFTVRHMAISKVRGRFGAVAGEIVTTDDLSGSTVTAEIDVTSLTTFNEARDGHLKTGDFFETETHPNATFRSTGIRHDGDDYLIDGELTLKGTTQPVTLVTEIAGLGPDAYGGTRVGFSAKGSINRRDFGLSFDARLDTGGLVVADKVDLQLDVEAVLSA